MLCMHFALCGIVYSPRRMLPSRSHSLPRFWDVFYSDIRQGLRASLYCEPSMFVLE